ncbi:MAG: tail fiber domain-containing protein [Erysipelotrichaceae bacterium]|nr:tail fiber domain-containing protein [Erysipelotrichaceae bacterium]
MNNTSSFNSSTSLTGYIRLGANATPLEQPNTSGALQSLIYCSASNNIVIGDQANTSGGNVHLYSNGGVVNFYTAGNTTSQATINSAGSYRIGYAATNTSSTSRVIYCYWADGSPHNLVEANYNGLSSYLGWSGSSSYATITTIRGQTCRYTNSSGTTTLSDKNLKKDFISLSSDAYDTFFDNLNPTAFKYILGRSGRHHFG